MNYLLLRWLILVTVMAASKCFAAETAVSSAVVKALPPHAGCCVLAIDQGKPVFEYSDGLADVEAKAPCTPETNFRMASVSKQFTATAILLLAERGKLALDARLTEFFPGFPDYGSAITVHQLLVHTSGLPAYEELIPEGTTLQLGDDDVLHLLMDATEPRFRPGTKFEYSNSGYALLGLIVEVVARQPFHDYLASEVFKPLEMDHTVMYQRGLNSVANRAYGHVLRDGNWVRSDQSLTSAVRGDGGVYSSLRDYRKWLTAIDKRQLLGKSSYEAMFSSQVKTDRGGNSYGYGWFIDTYRGEKRTHHNGETHGFRNCVQRYPERQAAVLVQINSDIKGLELTELGERLSDILIFDRKK